MIIKIGIPRALLYYRYKHLWESFFNELKIDYIVSPDTNRDIVRKGIAYAIDESCLSSKIYLGHVEWLIDQCDYILVPRISGYGSDGTVCSKFQAIYDVVANTFRDRNVNLLSYNIDPRVADFEMVSFLKMGKILGKRKSQCLYAYLKAKQVQNNAQLLEINEQERLLNINKLKILLIAHRYNISDKYIGEPILNLLREQGAVPIIGDIAPKRETLAKSSELTETLPWTINKELVGSIPIFKDRVDGIILISTFPCGPDSLVSEIIIRRVTDKPILNLMIDAQEGNIGIETRLESFLDIIRFKKDEFYGKD
ncbi:acyl-CoA dehydratase activase-related protein [Desulfosporosinus sp. SYSU MS00001]|uniref:acyl-CoA dehydratase activase-related protein n=1 Tax=Desulfosporosinus sp. SYSU MS00001 TaxID=3416284 RepID=UPI003CE7E29E